MRMAGYKSTLQSYNERLDAIRAKLEAKTAVKEYDLTVDFRDYEGYEMPVTGFYSVNNGADYFFDAAEFTLFSIADADTVIRITMLDPGSPSAYGINCDVSGETGYVEFAGIEHVIYIMTVENFTGDATVYYREEYPEG